MVAGVAVFFLESCELPSKDSWEEEQWCDVPEGFGKKKPQRDGATLGTLELGKNSDGHFTLIFRVAFEEYRVDFSVLFALEELRIYSTFCPSPAS